MILNAAGFQTLMHRVPPTLMTKVNPPDFPNLTAKEDVLKPAGSSECEMSFMDEGKRFAIVLLKPNPETGRTEKPTLHVIFYQRCLSNFTRIDIPNRTINGQEIRELQCGEAIFKLYCALHHLDKAIKEEDKTLEASSLEAMEAVLSATKPAECKKATTLIKGFDSKGWDAFSIDAMTCARLLVAADAQQHAFLKDIAALARFHGVSLDHIAFYEAAAANDLRWGTGLTVEQMHDMLLAENSCTIGRYFLTLGDKLTDKERVFAGHNDLGTAIQTAFMFVLGFSSNEGEPGEFFDESVEAYRARLGSELGGVEYDGAGDNAGAKRSRSLSDTDISTTRERSSPPDSPVPGGAVFSRTLSGDL